MAEINNIKTEGLKIAGQIQATSGTMIEDANYSNDNYTQQNINWLYERLWPLIANDFVLIEDYQTYMKLVKKWAGSHKHKGNKGKPTPIISSGNLTALKAYTPTTPMIKASRTFPEPFTGVMSRYGSVLAPYSAIYPAFRSVLQALVPKL